MESTGSGAELYRAFADLVRLPLGRGEELVYSPLSRMAVVVGPEGLAALQGVSGFATLDQHAARIAAQGGGPAARVRAELAALARQGVLVSADELLQHVRAADAPGEAPGHVASVGIPTRDRPESLGASLASYVANGLAHGRTIEHVVADGAETEEGRARTRAVVAEVAARYGVPVTYIGAEEKSAYAALVAARAGVPVEVAEFALGNPDGYPLASGANRNALLLHGAGDLVAHVDDDTRARIGPVPGQLPGLALTSQDDPAEIWFPAPGEPALPDRVVADRAYPSFHEELLGKTVAACVEERRRDGLDLTGASARYLRRLAPRGRVRMTQIGCAGDTGTGSMWFLLLQSGRSRERLLVSEERYRHAFTRRQIVRAAPRAAITDGMFCMSMSIGFDARELLPPFLPVQRNTDGLFGIVLRLCFPGAFSGFLPWVTEHSPAPPRTTSFASFFAGVGQTASEDALCGLVAASAMEVDRHDPRASLRTMGAVLERWGSLPLVDFEDLVRAHVLRARSYDVAILDEALRRNQGSPAYWARDVERTREILHDALPRPPLGFPVDLMAALGAQKGRERCPQMVRRFGELLRCWPDLWDAALELRQQGVRPGVVLR